MEESVCTIDTAIIMYAMVEESVCTINTAIIIYAMVKIINEKVSVLCLRCKTHYYLLCTQQ